MSKGTLLTWGIMILSYIINIVVVAIVGANLFSNIMGWICCIILAIGFVINEYSNKKMFKLYNQLIELQRLHFESYKQQIDEKKGGQE